MTQENRMYQSNPAWKPLTIFLINYQVEVVNEVEKPFNNKQNTVDTDSHFQDSGAVKGSAEGKLLTRSKNVSI